MYLHDKGLWIRAYESAFHKDEWYLPSEFNYSGIGQYDAVDLMYDGERVLNLYDTWKFSAFFSEDLEKPNLLELCKDIITQHIKHANKLPEVLECIAAHEKEREG